MKRFVWVIGVKEKKLKEYKKLHAVVWPEIQALIKKCNIENYSIYLRQLPDGKYYLFSYLEYCGEDFEADMEAMAADSINQKWWDCCKPCQEPLANRAKGEWWSDMEEVFHLD